MRLFEVPHRTTRARLRHRSPVLLDRSEVQVHELVSVIVPVYNVEELLPRCVDSILGQSHLSLQVLLVDDGSTDDSGGICDGYAAQDDRVQVIHQPNRGQSQARNAGLDSAIGNFITFVDSDDWIHERLVESLIELMGADRVDISICRHVKVDSDEPFPEHDARTVAELSSTQALRMLQGPDAVLMSVLWGKLYRRHLFDALRLPPGRQHEDEYVAHRLIWRARRLALTSERLYYYWQREGSLMASRDDPRKRMDSLSAFWDRAEFYDEVGLPDDAEATYWLLLKNYLKAFNQADRQVDPLWLEILRKDSGRLARRVIERGSSWTLRLLAKAFSAVPDLTAATYSAQAAARKRLRSLRQRY